MIDTLLCQAILRPTFSLYAEALTDKALCFANTQSHFDVSLQSTQTKKSIEISAHRDNDHVD